MIWSQKIIQNKYSILHIEIVIVKMTNRLLFEKLLKVFEMKKCERLIKNCILRQCFNCQKYDHIDKRCKIVVVCDICAKKHCTNDCDLNIIDKYKKCDACENREHIEWVSNCKMLKDKWSDVMINWNDEINWWNNESRTTRKINLFEKD
jgi:hypothetical protein